MKLYGAIDIGTNTVLCLAGYMEEGNLRVVIDSRYHYRAGRRYDAAGNLSTEYKQRLHQALQNAINELAECGDALRMVATEVLRRAEDGADYAAALSREFGVNIEIISPEKEAALGFLGATHNLAAGDEPVAVLDVGGGSTELAVGAGRKIRDWQSIKIGAAALAEEVGYEKPLERYLERADYLLKASAYGRMLAANPFSIIAIGGSAVTLAIYGAGLGKYPDSWPNGLGFKAAELNSWLRKLASMKIDERREAISFDCARADIVVPGGAILMSFMNNFKVDFMTVSPGGLRYGLLLEQFGRIKA